jgi:cell division inhibitor SepF
MAVGDLWHRTLVYFGMADEADDYDDDHYDDDHYDDDDREREQERNANSATASGLGRQRAPGAATASGPTCAASAPAGEPDFDDIFAEEAPGGAGRRPCGSVDSRPAGRVHLVVPKSLTTPSRSPTSSGSSRSSVNPRRRDDLAKAHRLLQRAHLRLDGGMQRVADKVFMLTPRNGIGVTEERARLLEKGFFNCTDGGAGGL